MAAMRAGRFQWLVVLVLILTSVRQLTQSSSGIGKQAEEWMDAVQASIEQVSTVASEGVHVDAPEVENEDVSSSPTTHSPTGPIIDVISIGSIHQKDIQDAQESTFGSHVRHFYRLDERNDTETNCHSQLTDELLQNVVTFCKLRRRFRDQYDMLYRLTGNYARYEWLKQKKNPLGWMCAQKRPIDGLLRVLKQQPQYELPDYLWLMDDDTWIHPQKVPSTLVALYPPANGIPYVVAGCMVRSRVHEMNFTMPFGGWGTVLNRAALEQLQKPIVCRSETINDDEFVRNACLRLQENLLGEQSFFQEGMSVLDLMEAYTFRYPYLDVRNWTDVGYCLHSDWNVGYFVNYYNIASHSGGRRDVPQDRLRGYNQTEMYTGAKKPHNLALLRECLHASDVTCTPDSAICHYVTADHMRNLYQQLY